MRKFMLAWLMLTLMYMICTIIQDNANYDVLFLGYSLVAAGWVAGGDAK